MRRMLLSLAVVLCAALPFVGACSSNAVEERGAKPGMMERVKQDAVTGQVVEVGKQYVSIRESNGDRVRVRVDEFTKMDVVQPGDQVKAYVNESGYATTLQRVPN
jgi:ribosomal protein S1